MDTLVDSIELAAAVVVRIHMTLVGNCLALDSLDTGTAEVVEGIARRAHNADSEGLELLAGSVVRKLDGPVLSSDLMVVLHGSLQYLKHTKIHFDINLFFFHFQTHNISRFNCYVHNILY